MPPTYRVANNNHLNLSGTLRQMRYLGRLYEYSENNFNDLLEFQEILDRNDNARSDVFDVRLRMFQVHADLSRTYFRRHDFEVHNWKNKLAQ